MFCGIDWAEGHHDIALVDETGQLVAKKRIHESVTGFAELVAMFEAAADTADDPIPVAIETPRGLLVAALRATGRPVFAINPMAVARYREHISVSRTKSDHADAMALANILRTYAHLHRRIAAGSELVQSIAVLARAPGRDLAPDEGLQRAAVAAAGVLPGISRGLRREAGDQPRPPRSQSSAGDRRGSGRRREAVQAAAGSDAEEGRPTPVHRATSRRTASRLPGTAAASTGPGRAGHGPQALALLATLDVECRNVDELSQATAGAFQQHPDHAIITSFPGLSDNLGARVLAEIGDDRTRFADARAVKVYAGSAPTTRASGRSLSVSFRRIKNDRLAAAGYLWALAAMANHEPATAHYRRRRDQATGTHRPCEACSTANSASYDRGKAFASPADPTTSPPLTEAAA